jgi:Flp pilus assembly pilin Flp
MKWSKNTQAGYRESGAGLVEFSVLVALIAVMVVVSVRTLGATINEKFIAARYAIGAGGFEPLPCNPAHPSWPSC